MDLRCGRCDGHHYDRAIAAGIYEHGLAAAIISLKSNPHIPPRCSTLILKTYLRAGFNDVSLIIPVPLSEKRMLERGYNQAEVLARSISEKARTPFRTDILIRTRHTPMHRVAMDDKARRLTVEKSFEVLRRHELADAHVVLVDDVFTSGATVSACARILKKNGARRVDVLTLARAAYD